MGNERLSYADSNNDGATAVSSNPNETEIIAESNYYPFGLKHKGYNNVVSSNGNSVAQKFGYNGVELEESLGLNLMEMNVRLYDPTIGRFNGIDPVTHFSLGTSVAFDNNPIFWADPSGADAESDELVGADGLTNSQWVEHSRPGGGRHDAMRAESRANFAKQTSKKSSRLEIGEVSAEVDDSCPDCKTWLDWYNWFVDNPVVTENVKQGLKDTGIGALKGVLSNFNIETTDLTDTEEFGFFAGIVLFALLEPGPGGEAKLTAKGLSVIGPRANYREFAKKIGANFLNVTDEAWTMRKNVNFLQGVIKRGDDVIFSGKYNPVKLDPSSILAQEIRYLQKNGYSWDKGFTRMIKK